MTQIEKRAYYMLTRNGEFANSKVFLVNRPVADAIAMGISVKNTRGDMVVNIGAQSTEISVIADGRVILSRVSPIGGFTIDTEIVDCVRRYHQMFIGMRTATRLKLSMGNLEVEKKEARKAMGISSVSGLPKEGTIASEVVNYAILSVMKRISEDIRSVLERTPPQVRSEIRKKGFYLLGGTSSLPGIDKHLAEALEYPVLLSMD
jgi:rod shape-determining protein MreB